MLLNPNRKKHIATIIVGGMKPDYVQKMGEKSEHPEMDMPEYEGDMGDAEAALVSAMQKFAEAMEAKDAQAMAGCLKDAVHICMKAEEESYENSEGE